VGGQTVRDGTIKFETRREAERLHHEGKKGERKRTPVAVKGDYDRHHSEAEGPTDEKCHSSMTSITRRPCRGPGKRKKGEKGEQEKGRGGGEEGFRIASL